MEKHSGNNKLSINGPYNPAVLFLNQLKRSKVLISALILYIILIFISPHKTLIAFGYGMRLFINTLVIFISVSLFVGLLKIWVKPGIIKKFFGKKAGLRRIITASLVGTVIVGPFYIIFPILEELLSKGARVGVIATIISAWAIKTPWLPYGALFLGWKFIIIFTLSICFLSLIEGYIVEFFVKYTSS